MPYSSSARSSRPSSYGSSRRGGRSSGGGSSNAVAYVVAGVVVLGVVGLVIALSGGKKDAPPAPTPTPTVKPVAPPPPPATKPSEPPWPEMPASKYEEAKHLASSFDADARRADALLNEAGDAKRKGDDALWQKKLGEAKAILHDINDKWNDFIATLPHNKDHDEEQVVAHFFPRENGQVATYTKKLSAMKASERMK
jgi:hypothetical protein